MPTPEDEPGPPRRRPLIIAALIAAVVVGFIVIHLTGLLGPGSH